MSQGPNYNLISPFGPSTGGVSTIVSGTFSVGTLNIGNNIQLSNSTGNILFVQTQSGTIAEVNAALLVANSSVQANLSNGNGNGFISGTGVGALSITQRTGLTATANLVQNNAQNAPGYLLQGIFYQASAAGQTLTLNDCGKAFTNIGATGTVVFTLPTPIQGFNCAFSMPVQQPIVITTPSGNFFCAGLPASTTRSMPSTSISQYGMTNVVCQDGVNYTALLFSGSLV